MDRIDIHMQVPRVEYQKQRDMRPGESSAMRLNPGVAFLLFLFYSALTGITLSSIFLVYTDEHIVQVFWITAGVFFV